MYKIFHNPRCSKSRQTLQLLKDNGVDPEVILYLDNPPSPLELKKILNFLGYTNARDLMRRGEAEYKALGLKDVEDNEKLIDAMAQNPRLIERPIVIKGQKAVLGRPPENALTLL